MPILRLNQMPIARGEELLAEVWRFVEARGIGSPKLAVEVGISDSLDMRLVFNTIADVVLVRHMLMRSAWSSVLKQDLADNELASVERYQLRPEECRIAADMRHSQSRASWRRSAEDDDLLGDSIERKATGAPGRKKPGA